MSFITVLIIDSKKLFVKHVHWREAKALLASRITAIEKSDASCFTMDEGYVLIDLNKREVANGQDAFCIPAGWVR